MEENAKSRYKACPVARSGNANASFTERKVQSAAVISSTRRSKEDGGIAANLGMKRLQQPIGANCQVLMARSSPPKPAESVSSIEVEGSASEEEDEKESNPTETSMDSELEPKTGPTGDIIKRFREYFKDLDRFVVEIPVVFKEIIGCHK